MSQKFSSAIASGAECENLERAVIGLESDSHYEVPSEAPKDHSLNLS
jgi:DNA modification methylase